MRNYLDYDIMAFYGGKGHDRESQKLPSFNVIHKEDIKEVMDLAQTTTNPSDITLLQTKLQYEAFGQAMKRRNIPYKMRISKNPVETHSETHMKRYWVVMPNSLLIHPITMSILRLKVQLNGPYLYSKVLI